MRITTRIATIAALGAAIAGGASSVKAQADDYPNRPVQLIVPFPPGGVAELACRPVSLALANILKQPVVIINRPGAGGATGNAQVANAKPDGYTLLCGLASMSAIPEAEKVAGKPLTYRLDQFAPIARITADPLVMITRAESPWKSIHDLIKDAKSRPGKISYASSGVYGNIHVAVEMLGHASDSHYLHVPYAGGGPANKAALAGEVEFTLAGMSSSGPLIRSGKMRPVAVWGEKRLAATPETPTLKEQGFDVEFYIWTAMFAPTGTAAPIMNKLRVAVRHALNDAEVKAQFERLLTPIAYLDGPDFKPFWDQDTARLAATIKRIGRLEDTK